MLTPPPFFRNRAEFLKVALVLIAIIATRLFFIHQDYNNLKNLKGYYYTEAQVLKLYDGKGYRAGSKLLKLKSDDGLDFYIYTKGEVPKRFDWVRVKFKLKKNSTFFDYLKGFFAYGDIVEPVENGFDAKAYLREKINKQHNRDNNIEHFTMLYF